MSLQPDRACPTYRDWTWSEHWVWFSLFMIAGAAANWMLDSDKGFQSMADFGRLFVCVVVAQLIAVHLKERQINGPNYRAGYQTLKDWLLVTSIRAVIYTAGYFAAAFLVLLFLSGGGFEPRR